MVVFGAAETAALATAGESVGILGLRQVIESDVARSCLIHESSLARFMRGCWCVKCSCFLYLWSAAPCGCCFCLLVVHSRMLKLLRMHVERWRVLAIRVVWTRFNLLKVQQFDELQTSKGFVAPNSRRKSATKLHGRETGMLSRPWICRQAPSCWKHVDGQPAQCMLSDRSPRKNVWHEALG